MEFLEDAQIKFMSIITSGAINSITNANVRLCLNVTVKGFSPIVSATTTAKGANGEMLIDIYQHVRSVKPKEAFERPMVSGLTVKARVETVIIM